jgi:hypothetical protein
LEASVEEKHFDMNALFIKRIRHMGYWMQWFPIEDKLLAIPCPFKFPCKAGRECGETELFREQSWEGGIQYQ